VVKQDGRVRTHNGSGGRYGGDGGRGDVVSGGGVILPPIWTNPSCTKICSRTKKILAQPGCSFSGLQFIKSLYPGPICAIALLL
jgi:hypothetical protein